jgi:hypothetical protein
MRIFTPLFVAVLAGCGASGPSDQEASAQGTASEELRHRGDESNNPNPMLFPKDARPYGRTMSRWAELTWSYIYGIAPDENPFFDTTGEHCAVDQHGPVWFLPAVPGSSLGNNVSRSCTIPHGRAIMLQMSSAVNDYPCPDPSFHPAPGQSLYDFLYSAISPLFDNVTGFTVTLDGVNIQDPLSYRFFSPDVFRFKPDPAMVAFDSCVTVKHMEGVVDGFYLLFKPMTRGQHTIVLVGHDMEGVPVTLTEHLTIQ